MVGRRGNGTGTTSSRGSPTAVTKARFAIILVAIVAPVILFSAVVLREPMPVMGKIPPLEQDYLVRETPLLDRADLWDGVAIETRLFGSADFMVLELYAPTDLARPDLLVIWQSAAEDPQDRFVLGSLAAGRACRFLLPAHAARRDGELRLYSLGHDETIGVCTLPSATVFAGGRP